MSKGALADELIKIIETGDIDYARAYYTAWCSGTTWPSGVGARLKVACAVWGVDPTRFGYAPPEEGGPTERISYETANIDG